MVDTKGILGKHRKDLEMRKAEFKDKWKLCNITNAEGREGDIPAAMKGADVVIALSKSGPGIILPEWVKTMAKDGILFACANPVPEIWPAEALAAGAGIVATGRSDFSNQVNNSLVFPGMFRGVLDVRARAINEGMAIAAAVVLADYGVELGLRPDSILPNMEDPETAIRIAVAAGLEAQRQGMAQLRYDCDVLRRMATRAITRSRGEAIALLNQQHACKGD